MRDVRGVLVAGLRDAHAMEQQAKDMTHGLASRLDEYPELAARAAEHARESEAQIGRLGHCLELIGEGPSLLKDMGSRTVGSVQGLMRAATSDEVIKDTLTGYAFESFEIASYRSLIAVARELGEERLVPLLADSLREEEAMAGWIGERIESITEEYCRMTSVD